MASSKAIVEMRVFYLPLPPHPFPVQIALVCAIILVQ
jgi:hypothetical protein